MSTDKMTIEKKKHIETSRVPRLRFGVVNMLKTYCLVKKHKSETTKVKNTKFDLELCLVIGK